MEGLAFGFSVVGRRLGAVLASSPPMGPPSLAVGSVATCCGGVDGVDELDIT